MKNILCLSHYAGLYGANKSLLDIVSDLNTKYCFHVVINGNGPALKKFKTLGVKTIPASFHLDYDISSKGLWSIASKIKFSITYWRTVLYLIYYCKRHKIRLIYTNTSVTTIGNTVASIRKIPHIIHIREFQDLDYNLRLRKPNPQNFYSIFHSSHIIAVSKSVALHFGVEKQANIIANGPISSQNSSSTIYEHENYFLFVGFLTPQKGIDKLLYAIKEIPQKNVHLFIVGDGDPCYIEQLKELGRFLDISDRINLMGYHENVLPLMQKAIALIVPSNHEAFGRITIEAFSQSCPVIGFASGGTKEILEPIHGSLFTNHQELIFLMLKHLKDTNYRQQQAIKGYNTFMNHYTRSLYINKIDNIYHKSIHHILP